MKVMLNEYEQFDSHQYQLTYVSEIKMDSKIIDFKQMAKPKTGLSLIDNDQ